VRRDSEDGGWDGIEWNGMDDGKTPIQGNPTAGTQNGSELERHLSWEPLNNGHQRRQQHLYSNKPQTQI